LGKGRIDSSGQGILEYALVLALVSLVAAVVMLAISQTAASIPAAADGSSIAAYVAAGVALVVAVISATVSWMTVGRQQRFTYEQQQHDWRVSQLNELYGPLRMYRETCNRLRKSLPAFEPDGHTHWPLVDHLPEAKADHRMRLIVDEIVAINTAIEDLLIHKAGLMEPPDPTDNFRTFMEHSRLLQIAWRASTDLRIPHFPYGMDKDIEHSIKRIEAARDRFTEKDAERRGS
jgi:hypothetical protein